MRRSMRPDFFRFLFCMSCPEIGCQKTINFVTNMHGPKVDRSIREAIVAEYLSGGVTLRELEKKYGYHFAVIGQWTRKFKQLPQVLDLAEKLKKGQELIDFKELPEDVRLLQDQLRMANLKNQLLEAMLDIGKEQYGLDLRKKSGTKPS